MLPGQMSPIQLESILDVHRNLPLKIHQNRVSWDIPDIEFLWGGLQSHFMVKPNLVLRLGWGLDNRNSNFYLKITGKSYIFSFLFAEYLYKHCSALMSVCVYVLLIFSSYKRPSFAWVPSPSKLEWAYRLSWRDYSWNIAYFSFVTKTIIITLPNK